MIFKVNKNVPGQNFYNVPEKSVKSEYELETFQAHPLVVALRILLVLSLAEASASS